MIGDFLNGTQAAITAPDTVTFAALNLMSDNPGMRWDLSETKTTIGYQPQDGQAARLNLGIRLKSWLIKVSCVTIPRYMQRTFPHW